MRKLYFPTLLLASLTSLCGYAQTEDNLDGEFVVGRPQCSVQVEAEATDNGQEAMEALPQRVKRKVGVPGTGMPVTGTPKIPIVLVEFADRPFCAAGNTAEEVRANYELFFNGYDDEAVFKATGSYGSVFSYYDEMSKGKFLPDFEIIGPVRLNEGYAHYGSNSPGRSKDINISSFYQEAVTKAVKLFDVDWNQFDNNGDGKVDMVYFVHAGWGENILNYKDDNGVVQNMDPDAIWAKEGTSSQSVSTDDGKTVVFACFGVSAEARYKSGTKLKEDVAGEFGPTGYNPENLQMDGIGVCIHEISHALGLPDFYDTVGDGYGMDSWSVMDYGEYANNGYNPGGYNAYERSFMGWEELPALTEPQVLTISCFADGGHGYKIVNPANADEYYVIENRQPKGWDEYACKYGNGLAITHVDYLKSKWTGNRVNTLSGGAGADHQRMTPIAANNEYKTRSKDGTEAWRESQKGMCFPGNQFVYDFTDETNPAARVYSGMHVYSGLMGQPLRNITLNEDATITVCFRTNGKLEVPEELETAEVSANGFTALWHEVENATMYAVEMEEENGVLVNDTVRTSSFSYEGLHPSTAVRCRVKALADSPEDYVESDWSPYVEFYTDVDYVDMPDSEREVTVFAMNGMAVSQCKAGEVYRLAMRPGIYVLKYEDGTSRKVVLK